VVGVDYMGVIVGILSLLVTVLIGWNIYSIMDFNKKSQSIDTAMGKAVCAASENMRCTAKAYMSFLSGEQYRLKQFYEQATGKYIEAINESLATDDKHAIHLSLSGLVNIYIDYKSRYSNMELPHGMKISYIATLHRVMTQEDDSEMQETLKLLIRFFDQSVEK